MKNAFYPVAEHPDFPAMTPDAAEEALPNLLADAKASVDALEEHAVPTWDGFVLALDAATRPFDEAWGMIGHLLGVMNSEAWRKVQAKYQPEMVAFSLRVGQSKKFYTLARTLRDADRKAPCLTDVRRRILDKMIRGFEHAGVGLEGAAKARYNEIQTALAKAVMDFRDHVLDATKAFSLVLTTPAEAAGMTAQLKAMTTTSGDPEKGPWKVTIEDAVYAPFMKHSANRAAREALCRARATRASAGPTDNTALIAQILALRGELAKILGYRNFAALSLSTKTAKTEAAVRGLIGDLGAAAAPAARREDAELAAFAASCGFTGRLEPWDRAFWAERRRETLFSYKEEELMEYFNFPDVLNGLFDLAGRLFGIAIEDHTGEAPVWHKDVRFYRVYDEFHTPVAEFYLDPYSRPATKQGGAWMDSFRARERRRDGSLASPLAVICCNQSTPAQDGTSLMRLYEVETIFHEFGHALQHMLTKVEDGGASGINGIEWDAVEVASQFMENWCTDRTTLLRLARHVRTGAPIPDALFTKVRAAKTYRAGSDAVRQLAFAATDFDLHSAGVPTGKTADDVKNADFEKYMPGSTIPGDRFLNAFTHIFAGGYAAGYYGYKWSEVMSADVFGAFEEAGLGDEAAVRRIGRRYRDTFLALGGGTDPMEVFRRFRGRAPTIAAILRQNGLGA